MIFKLKGIVLVVILSLASIMMPFNVYADTLTTNNIKGINTVLLSKTQNKVSTNEFWYVYEHTITLDANYVGTINLNVNLTYYNPSGSSQTYGVTSLNNKDYYVNGNTIKVNQVCTSDNYGNQGPYVSSSYLLNSSNVIKYDDIDSLEQIINLLTDIYASTDDIEGLNTNQLTELQKIVANTSLANDYLEVISQLRQWHVPIESYSLVTSAIMNNLELIGDTYNYQYFDYPIYKVYNNDTLVKFRSGNNTQFTFIFFSSLNLNVNNIKTYLTFSGNCTINNIIKLNQNMIYMNAGNGFIYKILFTTESAEYFTIQYTYNSSGIYIPFYLGNSNNLYISTDFALQFGLSNQLLDDLHIIANGTQQSNSAASDLEQEASEYSDIADDVIGVEEGLTSNFETSVNQIDLNTGLSGFGGNFMTSATWVRTQFDRLTENTPYGSLVVYGLTLGFVLLMLGKVLL